MALVADQTGTLKGKFTIPANVQAGSKSVELTGSGGSLGNAVFVGEGILVSEVLQNVTRTNQTYYDPLAQTFSLPEENQIGGVEVVVTAKGSTPISIQIRETQTGFPTQSILAEASRDPSQITVGAWNRFEFKTPVRILANVEYAIVVLCNDPVGAVAIAELGKWDSTNSRWVTQQPYQVGVLLSSSNASTWTAHQDRDLTFRLLARRYTETSRELDLGKVTVVDATDLVVLAMADNPATGADSELVLTLPNGSVVSTSDNQGINLAGNISGDIGVKARLRATQKASAMLYPGSQLVVGKIATTAEYVSRAVDADATGCKVRIIFDGQIPSGASVSVFIKGVDESDTWQAVSQDPDKEPIPVGNSVYEYNYLIAAVQEAKIRVKLVLTGTPAARPYIYNLRVSIT
ncbi:hypothetical protein D3C76_362370 [compost metagenome]